MLDFSDALFLITEARALINRALIGYAIFLVVYKFLLPLLFRSWKIDPILVMSIIYFLLLLSLKTWGPSLGW